MKQLYQIAGIAAEGDYIKLVLKKDIVKEKPSAMSALKDLGGFIEQMKMDASMVNNPDVVRIPVAEYDETKHVLGAYVQLEMEVVS